MKITYDRKADAMYIYLSSEKKRVTDTRELDSGWIADYAGDELLGIEILGASKVLGSKLGIKPNYSSPIPHKIR